MQQPSPKYIEEALKDADTILSQPEFDFDAEKASLEKPVQKPEAIIKLNGEIIATPGNIVVLAGLPKSGKSAVNGGLCAGGIAPKGATIDTLGFEVRLNANYLAVVVFDSEQSDYNHDKAYRSICARGWRSTDLEYFASFSIRKYSIENRVKFIEQACAYYAAKCGGMFMIVIDGIADLINSPNDEEQSNHIIDWAEKLAIQYHCPLITVLHFNPNSDKERGHLGSQLQRKAESVLSIAKIPDTNQSRIQGKLLRNAGDIPEITFEYSKEKGYHILVDMISSESKREHKQQEKERENLKKLEFMKDSFADIIGRQWMKNKDFIAHYMQRTDCKKRAADTHWSMVKHLFQQNENGEYTCK